MTEKTFEETAIYFVRHGQTDWNVADRIQGSADNPLNEKGRADAERCGEELKQHSINIDTIISSNLIRAEETARIIKEYLSLPYDITSDERLRERSAGRLEGEVEQDVPGDVWKAFSQDPKAFDAETLEEVYERVKSFLIERLESGSKERTLVVTHNGIIRMARYCIDHPEGFSEEEYQKNYANYGARNAEIVSLDLNKMKRIMEVADGRIETTTREKRGMTEKTFEEIVESVDQKYLLALQWEEAKKDPLKTADVFGWRDEEKEKEIEQTVFDEFKKDHPDPNLYDENGNLKKDCEEFKEFSEKCHQRINEEYLGILHQKEQEDDFFINFNGQRPENVKDAQLNIAAVAFWISQTHPGWDAEGHEFKSAQEEFKKAIVKLYNESEGSDWNETVEKKLQEIIHALPDNHISLNRSYKKRRTENNNHVGANLARLTSKELLTTTEREAFENAKTDIEKEKFYDLMDKRLESFSDDEMKQKIKDRLKNNGITDENPFIEVVTNHYKDKNGQERTEKEAFLITEKVVNGKKIGVIALPSCNIEPDVEFERISNALFKAFEDKKDNWAGFVFDMRGNYGGNQHLYDRMVARIMGADIDENGNPDVKLGAEVVGEEGRGVASKLVACGNGGRVQSKTYYKQKPGQSDDDFLEEVRNTEADRVRKKGINKPVYVLTNGRTASSGETILSMLYGHPKLKQVGEYTAGCEEYGNRCNVSLPCGISLGIGTVLRKLFQRNVETHGFRPDIRVPRRQDAFKFSYLDFVRDYVKRSTAARRVQRGKGRGR